MVKKLAVIGALAVTSIFCLTGCGSGKTKVELNKYVTITASGVDSIGEAEYEFDTKSFLADYDGKIKVEGDEKNLDGASELFMDCIDADLDKDKDLSNGDTITLKWSCRAEVARARYNTELIFEDIPYTVSGLEMPEEFDPFKYISVEITGTSPNGELEIKHTSEEEALSCVAFIPDKDSGISSEEEIKVTASADERTLLKLYKKKLSKTEETYSEKLAQYITKIDDVPQDMYNKMDKQLQDTFKSKMSSDLVFGTHPWNEFESMELVGNYIKTLKEGTKQEWGEPNNKLYFIYKITLQPTDDEPIVYYWWGAFTDTVILPDGVCTVDLMDYKTCSSSIPMRRYNTIMYGVTDLDSFFNKSIVTDMEHYDYATNIEE